jgi:hypothetical protein
MLSQFKFYLEARIKNNKRANSKKAISKKNEPIENFFVFDGNSMSGDVMRI